jgi:prepilin-type N-terminal cleavage/methylation domain-containing protein
MPISRAGVRSKRGLPSPASAGFTLIELTLVILVIGIVGALVLPRFGGLIDRQQARRTVNVLRGMVRQLHAKSALTKRIYRLNFDLEGQRVTVCHLQSMALAESADAPCVAESSREMRGYVMPNAVRLLDVVSSSGMKIREGTAITHFHPTGLAEPSVVHLQTPDEEHVTLFIEALAGRVKVVHGYAEREKG